MGHEWPAWEKDEALAARYGLLIRRKMIRRAGVKAMVERWLSNFDIPQRHSPGDAESFLSTHAGATVVEVLGATLQALWQEAWVLGAGSAAQLALEACGPLALGKSETPVRCDMGHDHPGKAAAGLLIRHHSGKKFRYLLQQRKDDGTWTSPGGSVHDDEDLFSGAMRETREEIGQLPADLRRSHAVTDDHGGWSYTTFVMNTMTRFSPSLDGATPDETKDAAWHTARKIRKLDLYPPFADSWDTVRTSEHDTHINRAMRPVLKARNPVRDHGGEPAKLPVDSWAVTRAQLIRQGIPAPMAGVLASSLEVFLQTDAATAMQGIAATLAGSIGQVLEDARDGIVTAAEAIQGIKDILDSEARALRIATTEVTRASAQAAQQVYILSRVTDVRWVTARDAKVCAKCQANADAGDIPLGDQFPSMNRYPPQHPNCRCAVIPSPQLDAVDGVGDIMGTKAENWLMPGSAFSMIPGGQWLRSSQAPRK